MSEVDASGAPPRQGAGRHSIRSSSPPRADRGARAFVRAWLWLVAVVPASTALVMWLVLASVSKAAGAPTWVAHVVAATGVVLVAVAAYAVVEFAAVRVRPVRSAGEQRSATAMAGSGPRTDSQGVALPQVVQGLVAEVQAVKLQEEGALATRVERAMQGGPPGAAEYRPAVGDPRFTDPVTHITDEFRTFGYAARQGVRAVAEHLRARQVSSARTLALRIQAGLARQSRALERYEKDTEDPEAIGRYFHLDMLAAGMQREVDSLMVLSGGAPRRWGRPQGLAEVVRGAISCVEAFARVELTQLPDESVHVQGGATADMVLMLAHLIDNATRSSRAAVVVSAQLVPDGLVIEVEDRGIGMAEERREAFNQLLANSAHADQGAALADGHLGLYVTAILAGRHGVRVQLRRNVFGAISAVMVLPPTLLELPDGQGADVGSGTGCAVQRSAPSGDRGIPPGPALSLAASAACDGVGISVEGGVASAAAGPLPARPAEPPPVHPVAGTPPSGPPPALDQRRAPGTYMVPQLRDPAASLPATPEPGLDLGSVTGLRRGLRGAPRTDALDRPGDGTPR